MAPDIDKSSLRTSPVSKAATGPSSSKRSKASSESSITTARYFPHGSPTRLHTRARTVTAAAEYFRSRRLGIFRGTPRRFAATVNCRRAFARDQPVTAMTKSRISPLRFFPARAYSKPCFFVISRRASIDNSPIPQGHRAHPGPGQHFREHP
ncbi:hypothetical protein [Paenarthrobacter sp. MSM-2-10-13]|uniref:hypothetical protein n=1 Tax=Paenarthrobacter sp. MSM-2-10-13 TaxID=2717318 RepID=UPI001FB669D7|nr:hypothetical protein [Paenarthrobacter sp. MSM-2-10-13]